MDKGSAFDFEGQSRLFGHPVGLFVLFFTELWERFSYYGMRALLIFYLVQHWLFSDAEAGVIYGAYTALVYITPVIGGIAALTSANLLDLIPNSTTSPMAMMMLGAVYAFLKYDPVETAQAAASDTPIPERRTRYSRFPPAHARGSNA